MDGVGVHIKILIIHRMGLHAIVTCSEPMGVGHSTINDVMGLLVIVLWCEAIGTGL